MVRRFCDPPRIPRMLAATTTAAIDIAGMNCASCVAHVSKAARSLAGVSDVSVNLARGRATVEFDPARTSVEQISEQISRSGYPSKAEQPGEAEDQRITQQAGHARAWLGRAIIGFSLWLPVELAHWILQLFWPHAHHAHANLIWVSLFTSTACLVLVGGSFYKSAWNALLHRTTNMDTLIAMGASVAYFYSLICLFFTSERDQLYFMESSALLALISLGHWLEANARRWAGGAIRELLNIAPAAALRLKENSDESEEIPVAQLQRNDRILIRPGDRVPVDGIVIDGSSSIDESMITGEPLPVTRIEGDKVIGGTLNADGRLVIRATAVGADTALSQIVQLVEKAQDSRPPVQKLADQIAAVFVPVVLLIAILTAGGWYAWGAAHHWAEVAIWAQIAKATCSVLLIACPCALGLAVPAAIMVGTGLGARRGILIRDIDALQMAEKIDTVVLDKTGTITEGKPVVTSVVGEGVDADTVLRLAAAAEQFSSHPIAKAILNEARKRGISISQPDQFNNQPGYGVSATVEGRSIVVGNQAMLDRLTAPPPAASQTKGHGNSSAADLRIGATASAKPQAAEGTTAYIAEKSSDAIHLLGSIEIADSIKPDSVTAILQLRAMGLSTVLLTGDNHTAAAAIAQQVAITDIHAEVRPAEKAAVIVQLQENSKHRVAMVGDGINDAPALAQADLGIALGSGSDVAKETGDIVLVGSSLSGVASAILLSRATMRIIRQNLFFAFIYNVLAIPLAAMGLLHPVVAAAAMALSDVTVIGNSLRLRWTKLPVGATRKAL